MPSETGDEVLPDEEAPGLFGDAIDITLIGSIIDLSELAIQGSDEPVLLQLEVLSLESSQAYESLHCYVGLGDITPRWYPDHDGDQDSTEYFYSDNGTSWQVEEYLAGHNALGIFWPGNQTLTFEITCVGIRGGGTDALDLGPMSLDLSPESWNGDIRTARTELGEGGGFSVAYRIAPETVTAKGPDRDMARPINLWISYGGGYLTWDYLPEDDDEPIDGFLIFLNDTLVLHEGPDAARTPLPDPWLFPYCGEEYEFTVVAYISPYDEGDHSVPREEWEEDYQGDRVTVSGGEPGSAECDRVYHISFLSLTTGAFPDEESRYGSGSVDGIFFTSQSSYQLGFDYWGIVPNTEYNLRDFFSGRPPSISISFAEGEEENIEWGFSISGNDMDGHYYGLMCEGGWIYPSSWFEDIIYYEDTIPTDGGPASCWVDYVIHLVQGSPEGLGEGEIPLPQLELSDLSIEPGSGQLGIHVKNVGTADWLNQDLDVRVTTQSGELILEETWEEFFLPVGDTLILATLQLVPDDPSDVCITLDYDDRVLELYEHWESFFHNPVCGSRPDLSIEELAYDSEGERLDVVVKNNGETVPGLPEGVLNDRDLVLRLEFFDSTSLERREENITLGQYDEIRLEWPELGPEVRDRMHDGYTVILDPGNEIVEVREDNNDYTVDGGTRLWLVWNGITAPDGYKNQVEFRFRAYAVNGDYRRQIIGWDIEQDITWDSCGLECLLNLGHHDYSTDWFDIYGDEELEVIVNANHPGALFIDEPSKRATWSGSGWGGGQLFDPVYCVYHPTRDPGHYSWTLQETGGGDWETSFSICRENIED
jgi:hypothetical protein